MPTHINMRTYVIIALLLLLSFLVTLVLDILVSLGAFYLPIPLLLSLSIMLKSWVLFGGIFLWIQLRRLHRKVEVDYLTGAHTREVFFRSLQQIIDGQGGQRQTEATSIIVFDLDNFKCINDEFGHKVGDEVLIATSRRVSDTIRQSDVFARTGGEEFAIILPRTPLDEAARLAHRLCVKVHAPSIGSCPVSASFGVGVWNGQESVDKLYERVDDLMYEAKHAGKNTVVVQH